MPPPPMPPDPAVLNLLLNPAKPWVLQVDVYLGGLTGENEDTLKHTLKTPAKQNAAGGLAFRNRGRPGFFVDFVLRDGLGYNFPPVLRDAVWSQAGNNCPNAEIWTVFWPMEIDYGTRTLRVYNANQAQFGAFPGHVGNFQYALRVTNGNGLFRVDPGGTNQNGNTD